MIKVQTTHLLEIESVEQKLDLSAHCLMMLEDVDRKLKNSVHIEFTPEEVTLLRMQRVLYNETYAELTTVKASTYYNLLTEVLEKYGSTDRKEFFADKLGIEFCDDYEYANNRQIRAATVEVGTADGYCLIMQKTNCSSREIYHLSEPDSELFYNEPDEVKFMGENLEIGAVYHCMDDENFFEAVSRDEEFMNEIALYLVEAAAEEANVAFKNDLND